MGTLYKPRPLILLLGRGLSSTVRVDAYTTRGNHNMTILNTTDGPSGDRIQTISFSMTDLVSIALETALNDGNGLTDINPDTTVSLEVGVTHDYDGAWLSARFTAGVDFDIVNDLDGSLQVIDLNRAGEMEASVILMITNKRRETA